MLFQVLGQVFSVSDIRNEVVDPAALLLCQCLSQCPVTSTRDIALGLLTCSVLMEYSHDNKKYYPEVTSFITSVLVLYCPTNVATMPQVDALALSTFKPTSFEFLRGVISKKETVEEGAKRTKQLSWKIFARQQPGSEEHPVEFSEGILFSTYTLCELLLQRFVELDKEFSCEALRSISLALSFVRPHDAPALPSDIQSRHLKVMEAVQKYESDMRQQREPLLWRKKVINATESKAPRYETNYTIKKDHGVDKERAKLKQLTRQLKREKKAAMRELRRDSDFIDQERFKVQQSEHEERRAERMKNFEWMADQQATINQQVKQGKGLLKGGGSNIAKKPRVKR